MCESTMPPDSEVARVDPPAWSLFLSPPLPLDAEEADAEAEAEAAAAAAAAAEEDEGVCPGSGVVDGGVSSAALMLRGSARWSCSGVSTKS